MAQDRATPLRLRLVGTGTVVGVFRHTHRDEERGGLFPFEGTVIVRGDVGGAASIEFVAFLGEPPSGTGTVVATIAVDTVDNFVWQGTDSGVGTSTVVSDLFGVRLTGATDADAEAFIYSRTPVIAVDPTL